MSTQIAMQKLLLRDFETEARRRLDPAVFDYFAGGADDEVTVRENESAFARIGLVPRALRGLSGKPHLDVTLLGSRLSMPVLIAPTAFHRLAHPDCEHSCDSCHRRHHSGRSKRGAEGVPACHLVSTQHSARPRFHRSACASC